MSVCYINKHLLDTHTIPVNQSHDYHFALFHAYNVYIQFLMTRFFISTKRELNPLPPFNYLVLKLTFPVLLATQKPYINRSGTVAAALFIKR